MSTALAIAAVTNALVNLLGDVDEVAGGTQVTAKPLDKARDNVQGHQLNVFLYQTAPDAAWRNQELPSSTRRRVRNDVAAAGAATALPADRDRLR